MATRRITGPTSDEEETVIESDGVTIDGAFDDITEILASDKASFDSILQEIGESEHETKFRMKAYRILPDKGANAWLFDFQPSELPVLPRLRDQYKGGTFEIRVYANGKLIKKPVVHVEAPSGLPPLPAASEAKNETADILRVILEETRSRNNTPPPVSRSIDLAGIAAIIGASVPVIKTVKDMFASAAPAQQTPPLDAMLDVLRQGMELGAARSENNGGEENLFGMISKLANQFAPPLLETYNRMSQTAQQGQHAAPQIVHGAPLPAPQAIPPGQQTQQPTNEGNDMFNILKGQLRMLVQQAARNSDPLPYAIMILDNMPAEQVQQFVLQPDALSRLQQLVPEVAMYPGWFEELKSAIIQEMQERSSETLTNDESRDHTQGQESTQGAKNAGGSPEAVSTIAPAGEGNVTVDS